MLNKEDILVLAWEHSEGSGKRYIFTEENLFAFLKELKEEPAPAQDERYTKGDTDPVGDCGKFEAGIHVGAWMQRIVAYGETPEDAERLRDVVLAALTRPAQAEQQPTVKQSLTVQPMAYAVFAANGNVACFSTRRDHPSLVAFEADGHSVVSLAPIAQDSPQPEQSGLLEAESAIRKFESANWHGSKGYHAGLLKAAAIVAALSAQGSK